MDCLQSCPSDSPTCHTLFWTLSLDFRLRLDLMHRIQYFHHQSVTFKGGCFDSPKVQQDLDNLLTYLRERTYE
jgi:hypothetical protein